MTVKALCITGKDLKWRRFMQSVLCIKARQQVALLQKYISELHAQQLFPSTPGQPGIALGFSLI